MTVTGPVVTTGDYISNGTGVLEKRWRYDITNTSSSGDINNMIEFRINAGSNNDVLAVTKTYSGTGTINLFINSSSSGFTGLLPSSTSPFNNNKVILYLITPADTPSAPGLAVATASGWYAGGDNFPSVPVDVPAALPTVDFTEDNGTATQISPTLFQLNMTVVNNMNTEPVGIPYNDYVSEIKIEGIYSATEPSFLLYGKLSDGWGSNAGYISISMTDPSRRLWTMVVGTYDADSRVAPGELLTFNINLTLPAGIPGSAIRYGAVAAQGRTGLNGYQPYPDPDTFIGPVGVEYPAPVVGLALEGGQVRLGLAGLVVGREYRVMRSGDLSAWDEAARFTVTEDPMPPSGRVDREWSEAAALPGRRFYKLEWDEP